MEKVIDVHAHVGSSAALYVGGAIDSVVTRMRKNGITQSVISPIPGYEDPEGVKTSRAMNEQLSSIQKENKDMFPLALAVAEPRHGKEALKEIEYALGNLNLGGLMFHHDFGGVMMHEKIMHEMMNEVMNYPCSRIVQMHTAQHSMLEPPFSLWILAEKYPEITFICGHPMMSEIQLDNMIAIANHCPNVFFDTCCMWNHQNIIERAVEELGGSDRIMFGSDNPYFVEDLCVDKLLVETSGLSEEDKENIFFKNFERLLSAKGGI